MATTIYLRNTLGRALTFTEMDSNFTNLQGTADAAKAVTDTVSTTPGSNQIPKCGADGALILPAYMFLGGQAPLADKRGYLMSSQYDYAAEPEGFLVSGGYSSVSTNTVMIGGGASSYNAASLIQFFTAANVTTRTGTEVMRITPTARLLIGSTVDDGANKLQVTGNLMVKNSTAQVYSNNTDATQYALFKGQLNGVDAGGIVCYGSSHATLPNMVAIKSYTTGPLAFFVNNTEYARVSAGGRFLIGSTVDDGVNTLQVNGPLAATGGIISASSADTVTMTIQNTGATGTYPYGKIGAGGTSALSVALWQNSMFIESAMNSGLVIGAYSGNLSFYCGATRTSQMRLTSNGNILIGTTSDDATNKLQVNGSAILTGNLTVGVPASAPAISTNGSMSFQLVSNTSLKILVRGSDGVTRGSTLTLT